MNSTRTRQSQAPLRTRSDAHSSTSWGDGEPGSQTFSAGTEAPTARRARIADYLSVAVPTEPCTAADGTTVFVCQAADAQTDRGTSELWIVDAPAGSVPRRLTCGPADSNPRWHEATGDVLFLRPDASGVPQLHSISPSGGEARALTTAKDFPRGVGTPVVSPDGKRIALTAAVDRRAAREDVFVTRGISYKIDGIGMRGSQRTHLFLLTVDEGAVSRVTDGDWDASEPAFSEDGAQLAFAAGIEPDSAGRLASRVHVINLGLPTFPVRSVGTSAALHAPLLWLPGEAGILAVGAAKAGSHNAELLLVDPAGVREDRSLTACLDRNVMAGGVGYPGGRPALTAGGEIVFALREGGSTHLWIAPLGGGAPRPLLSGAQRVVSGHAVGRNSVRAALSTASSFGELVEIPLDGSDPEANPMQLTAFGAGLGGVDFPIPQRRHFTISDGSEVEAFVLRDQSLTGPGPLVLDVHGGPHNAWTGTQSLMQPHHAELVARGYTVLMVNPRGSDGYGEAFFTAVHDGWGETDKPDLLEPVQQLVEEGIVDPAQLLITGYSYGGFMTAALTSQSGIFAAAVAGGLLCDLAHIAGPSDHGILLERFEFDPTTGNSRRLSPIENVHKVTTPTLVLHGDADLSCPLAQAEQWHAGLVLAGVESELVLYPGASHAFVLTGRPSHRMDYSRRLIDWFERHLSPTPARKTVDEAYWQRRLESVIAKYGIPGASLGILTTTRSGPQVITVAAGVLNTLTGQPVHPDSLFQIGSNTKVYTGVMIQQLVQEGLLDLDAPVRAVLPEFTVADETVSATVTPRHLLTHSSGIDGDVFRDTGGGDDAVEKFVAGLADVPQNFAPGEDWSYCNTAFAILGRIIEVLRGETWDRAVYTHIFEPLGLKHSTVLPDDTIRLSSAVGHDPDGPVKHVLHGRFVGPAGLINARVEDVLRFAADTISDSPVLLSRASYDAMLTDQGVSGNEAASDQQGLAWLINVWDGKRVHGHSGETLRQQSFQRISPDAGLAFMFAANGGLMAPAADELIAEVFGELGGIRVPESFGPEPDSAPLTDEEAGTLVGSYGDAQAQIIVTWADGVLTAYRSDSLDVNGRGPITSEAVYTLVRGRNGRFAAGIPGLPGWQQVWRRDHRAGTVLHFGTRAFRRRVAND